MGGQAAGWSEGPLGSAAARPSTPIFQPITQADRPGTAQPPAASTPGSANFLIKAGNCQADSEQAGQTVAGLYPKPPSTAPACASLHSGKPGAAPNPPADGLASFGISAAAFVAAAPKSAGQLLAGWAALTQAAMLAEAQLGSQENLRRFLLAPGPADQPLRCTIVRRVGGLLRGGTQYTLLLERDGGTPGSFLAAARKRKGGPGAASYILSVDAQDVSRSGGGYLGMLRANFVGTEFVLHDGGGKHSQGGAARCELAAALYQANVLGTKGPRKLTALLPKLEAGGRRPLRLAPKAELDTLLGQYKAYNLSSCVVLRNKPPRWNAAMGAYCLNFGGRVTQASVKNFQLVSVDNMERTILQFGKVAPDTFTMDYAYPMTALQAFALCLSSFASKLATQ